MPRATQASENAGMPISIRIANIVSYLLFWVMRGIVGVALSMVAT